MFLERLGYKVPATNLLQSLSGIIDKTEGIIAATNGLNTGRHGRGKTQESNCFAAISESGF